MVIKWRFFSKVLVLLMVISSCSMPHEEVSVVDNNAMVCDLKLRVGIDGFQHRASRAIVPIAQLCRHIDIGIYNRQGTLIRVCHQQADEKDFGKLSFRLKKGEYSLRVVGHNGREAVDLDDFNRIAFHGVMTDSYLYAGEISLQGSSVVQVRLVRCVACVQFVVKDKVPASVTQFRFTYSGGSTSYDLMKQSGSRSSTLVALFDVADSARRDSSVYTFYAIPLKRQRTLDVLVEALNHKGMVVKKLYRPAVSIQPNVITRFSGCFFATAF
jgi:hypothetical protein